MLRMFFFLIMLIQPLSTYEIFKFTVKEKSPINTLIADLSYELKIQNLALYSLNELIPINKNLITINNQTGHLTTMSIIDRDQMCIQQQCSCKSCEIIFQLTIQIQQTIIYKIIEIKIEDRNDHSPIFDNQSMIHIIHIKENVPLGYRIVLPIANDPDEGLNSVQSYSLDGINSDDFDVDYSSIDIPYLIVRSSLDHQRISSYSLTLIASDNNQQSKSRSGSIQFTIRIINDSMPTFLQSVYTIDIREDTIIGTNLLKIEAISDNNKQIFYELLTESPFIIDRLTGNIQLRKLLDYEREKSYRLIIKAYENLIPTYAIIFIRVIDINDNPVVIHIKVEGNTTLKQTNNDKNVLFIPEDTLVGTTLAHVTLTDLDSYVNGNPYLQLTTIQPPLPFIYKLIYQNNFQNFKLYSLILHTNLDRELKSIYNNIQLIAHDSGTPTLHTKLSILLNITDINDCIPQILTNSTIYDINENNPIGLILDTLTAYDCDLGINAEYEYSILNTTDLLVINARTGQLSLNQSIDFEKFHHQKNLTTINLEYYIQVKDHGQPSLSSQIKLILRIHDLNDNSPIFDISQSYNWTFPHVLLQTNSILGRILAYDNDSGLQGIVHYSIRSFDSCLILDITSLGYIYIQSQKSCSYLSYIFEITANDYGLPNSRLTKQLLTINIDSNSLLIHSLPQLLSLSIHQTIVDINSIGNISFIIDITNNHSIQPKVHLNNTDLLTCWNISSTGEVRLIARPFASSYILSLNIIDEYIEENFFLKFQIDICNSTMKNSCQQLIIYDDKKDNQILLFWTISLALMITCLCVFIFSIITCLCCRKQPKDKKLSTNQQSFLQRNEDFQSDRTFKSSSASTIREDDRDSACIINSTLSSNVMPVRTNSWYQNRRELSNVQTYQSKTCFYDIKIAELIRNNQHPACVFLNPKPSQSISTDYGFGSSDVSPSSTSCSLTKLNNLNVNTLEWNYEMITDQSPPPPSRPMNKNSFISTHECVV
ncbi:unnamed protein product [Adineta steineri]|uniref:Cadherin domain-containing protein n=2 Tax=Adineta steineri TaxID=433720 RepID=A0A814M9I9_9BILA|nr:unnamed protein product [Adineta steineri]CAF3655585.1 unnamed protein product [Adineta steineri]